MKKLTLAVMLVLAFATFAFAADSWEATLKSVNNAIKIREDGAKVLREYANLKTDSKAEYRLWQQLGTEKGAKRAAVAMTLVNTMFPNGNPGRWEEVGDLTGTDFLRPRQFMAIDALFAAVQELSANERTVWGAALLLEQFGSSAYGKVMFVEETPAEVQAIIENVKAKTGLSGDWTVKKLRGHLPFCPRYEGKMTHNNAENLRLIYLDNFGRLTSFGEYGWDRDRGLLYEIIEDNGGRGGKHD